MTRNGHGLDTPGTCSLEPASTCHNPAKCLGISSPAHELCTGGKIYPNFPVILKSRQPLYTMLWVVLNIDPNPGMQAQQRRGFNEGFIKPLGRTLTTTGSLLLISLHNPPTWVFVGGIVTDTSPGVSWEWLPLLRLKAFEMNGLGGTILGSTVYSSFRT